MMAYDINNESVLSNRQMWLLMAVDGREVKNSFETDLA